MQAKARILFVDVRTRAERTDEGWRVNGRKLWTTNAHRSHYMIALVRTSGAPRAMNADSFSIEGP